MFKRILTTMGLITALASPAAAAVVYNDTTKNLTITGRTNNFQASSVYRYLRDNDVLTVTLQGEGGDYYAGLRLGRLIEAEGSVVIIPTNQRCVSACAFAALATLQVWVFQCRLVTTSWFALQLQSLLLSTMVVRLTVSELPRHFGVKLSTNTATKQQESN